MKLDPALRRTLNEALGARPVGHGFERLASTGLEDMTEEQALLALRDEGIVAMAHVAHGFGPGRDRWEPSTLTDKGQRVLAAYRGVCPECGTPMTLTSDNVFVGHEPNISEGRMYMCQEHGRWHVVGDGAFRRPS